MAKIDDRSYDSSDLKELMDNIYDWAKNWNDVLWYIKNVAVYDADFAKDEIQPLLNDIRKLADEDYPFTYDYREIYKGITGKSCEGCPPPEGLKSHGINPREISDKWLSGLMFPTNKNIILKQAKSNGAPQNIVSLLQKVKGDHFSTFGSLIEQIGDLTWDHD